MSITVTAAATPEKELAPAALNSVQLLEQHNAHWRHIARHGVTREDLSDPRYWTIGCSKWRAGDRVDVMGAANGKAFWCELLVVDAERGYQPTVIELRYAELPTLLKGDAARKLPEGYGIRFDPATHTYTAFREKDGHPMSAPVPTYEAAWRALVDHAIFRN